VIASLFPQGVVTVRATAAMEREALRAEELAAVARACAERRREFAAGRACARAALLRLGLPAATLPARSDRTPAWPDGVIGSITHCAGYCAAALARRGAIVGLGLDAEVAGRVERGLVPRICSGAELEALAQLGAEQPSSDWPTVYFSAKESVYKCTYPLARTRLGFRDVEVEIEAASGRFRAHLVHRAAQAAAGARVLHGRFAVEGAIVLTGVTLTAAEISRAGA
jgi:4'-phosphopantetheinyl transferase EntD